MRRFSPGGQEVLRRRVMAAVSEGMSHERAAEVFGVSTRSITTWKARWVSGGSQGLSSGQPGHPIGVGTYLDSDAEQAIRQAILDYIPQDLQLGGHLWTRRKVGALIRRLYGVHYSLSGLRKLLHRWGLSFQRPDRRALQADNEAIAQWREETYPQIRKQAAGEGAQVYFGDQVGIRSDHLGGATWAEVGHTPTITRSGNRFSLNAMSLISPRGKLYFTIFNGAFNTSSCLSFLQRVMNSHDEKIHLILDSHPVHRSKKVTDFIDANSHKIQLHFLPAYAPHLNPDELTNAHLKRTLADRVITNIHDMKADVQSFFRSIQKLPHIIQSYFQAPHTNYASETKE